MEIITRDQAILRCETRYFTGKPCKHGHVAERLVSSWGCITCAYMHAAEKSDIYADRRNAARRKRYSANPNKFIEAANAWKAANLEKWKAGQRDYYIKNRSTVISKAMEYAKGNADKRRAYMAAYNEKNKDLLRVAYRNKKARRRSAEGFHTLQDVRAIRSRQKDKCVYCNAKLRGGGHIDHITALINGGTNWPSNLQLLCVSCNLSKSQKHPVTFAQEKGLLL